MQTQVPPLTEHYTAPLRAPHIAIVTSQRSGALLVVLGIIGAALTLVGLIAGIV